MNPGRSIANRGRGGQAANSLPPAARPKLRPAPKLPPPTVAQRFYGRRRAFRNNWPEYAKSRGFGKEFRLLGEIAARSAPLDPFAWAVINGQKDWAKTLGVSTSTLQRWLAELSENGHIFQELRPSPALRSKEAQRTEYPVFSIPEWLVEDVARMKDPTYWPIPPNPQNGYRPRGPLGLVNIGHSSRIAEFPPNQLPLGADMTTAIYIGREELDRSSTEIPASGTSRRRRRRANEDPSKLPNPPLAPDSDPAGRYEEPYEVFDRYWQHHVVSTASFGYSVLPHPWGDIAKPQLKFRITLRDGVMRYLDHDNTWLEQVLGRFFEDLAAELFTSDEPLRDLRQMLFAYRREFDRLRPLRPAPDN